MSTVNDRITDALVKAYPETRTNAQLADAVGAPVPSVRRSTRELSAKGRIIEQSGGYAGLPIQYAATYGVASASAQG